MTSSFEEGISIFEESEVRLNSDRHKLFTDCGSNLFFSEHYESYEESLEKYFFNINRHFGGDLHSKDIQDSLNSKDTHLRRSVLEIIKAGTFSDVFMSEIARKLIMLAIHGTDEDRVIVRKILLRKYPEKSTLISLLPDCISQFFKNLEVNSKDADYAYQNCWYIMLDLNAVHLLNEYIRFGENYENPSVRELAAEFKDDMEKDLRT